MNSEPDRDRHHDLCACTTTWTTVRRLARVSRFFALPSPVKRRHYIHSVYGSISDSHALGQLYMYCNRKIIVCGLPDADRQRYIDKFKSLDIDKCPYEIHRTECTDDSVGLQKGIDNIESCWQITSLSSYVEYTGWAKKVDHF